MKGQANFSFTNSQPEYTIVVKPRKLWWLWLLLLLLLPLLLLIRLEKDVAFKTINETDKKELANVTVSFSYHYRALFDFKSKRFFVNQVIARADSSNTTGDVLFEKTAYTVYSKLFFSLEKAEVTASGGCLTGDSLNPRFNSLRHRKPETIYLGMRSYDLEFQVVDITDGQPLPDAQVTAQIIGQDLKWSEVSDANGSVFLKNVPYCAQISINGQKTGYKGDTINNKVEIIASEIEKRTLFLDPLKEMIQFTVKDLYSKENVPNARATLLLKNDTIKVNTNTNGVGKGAFENIKITAQMQIAVQHEYYFDTLTVLTTVAEYVKLTEQERIIYIRPKTQTVVFRDIDGATGSPLPGVKNEIYINGKPMGSQMSNNNGTFVIANVKPSDKISIVASKPAYGMNNTKVQNALLSDLSSQTSRDIPLTKTPEPPKKDVPRVGCRAHFAGTLLADVAITGHISQIYVADQYSEYVGEGEYASNRKAFPKAVRTTFDGIAVDKGTRIIIYSQENFKGKVLLDIKGPAIINNVKWKSDSRIGDFTTRNFKGGLQSNFPPSCRRWSTSDMNVWDNGSLKVICDGQ